MFKVFYRKVNFYLAVLVVTGVSCHLTAVGFPPAPVVLGPESYDKVCDLWSLGVIMYIL